MDLESTFLRILPTEVIALILSHLDVASVAKFREVSQTCRSLVDGSEDTLYETLAHRWFDAFQLRTGGDTGISASAGVTNVSHSPLERAIRAMRTPSDCFEDAYNWRTYGMPESVLL